MAEKIQRCAVYTRKSTEDGLEKEFNSLDAQYEACAAYALSQKHEGWELTTERYDDGGFSGGNMERPGLKRLMADVAAGKVDIILVYKIDRLTRSLADFAKIVDVLDTAKASFVSITQSFNTTTSMGRLTLNMLLSFAQFEREVTGERIRDKIAASKRKGMWMGGPLPLGYDVDNRRLIVNAKEADLVRQIYRRYLELGSVVELADDLNAKGYTTKVQLRASGPHRGGCAFRRGTLYHLLSNPIYRGKIIHKGEVYPGEHEAIVPEDLFAAVQEKLKVHASGTSRRLRGQQPSLLTGILQDSAGRAMTPSHASKGKAQRYRYYVTRPDQTTDQPAYRVSAHDLEQIVITRVAAYFAAQSNIADLAPADIEAHALQQALTKTDITAATLRSGTAKAKHAIITQVLSQAILHEDRVDLTLSINGLAEILGIELDSSAVPITLEASLWSVARSNTFAEAVLLAANLGEETSSVSRASQRHGAADGDHPLDQFQLNYSDTTLPSKAAVVRALLRLEGGATLNEIMNATGWKACSCRSFLTSQRKHRRYKLMRCKVDGVSRYTLEVLR